MNYQNLVVIGYATKDPYVGETSGDRPFSAFTVAVNNFEEAGVVFFPVYAFGKLAKAANEYIRKGKSLLVEGRVRFDDEKFQLVAKRIVFGPDTSKNSE